MSQDFKSQIEDLIHEAAEKSVNRNMLELREADARTRHFKQGCDLLIPVLMRAVEELDKSEKELGMAFSVDESDIDARLENLKKELLNILKGVGK